MDEPRRRIQTSVSLDLSTWRQLRDLATARAADHGGRADASAVVADLVAEAAQRAHTAPQEAA